MNNSKFFAFEWLDNLFEAMFNLAYKLALVPYQIQYNEKQETYSVSTASRRKYISLILTVTAAIISSGMTNAAFSQVSLRTPAVIFDIAPEFGDIYLCFTCWYVIWRHKNEMCAFWSLMSLQTYKLWRQNEFQGHLNYSKSSSSVKHIFSISQKQTSRQRKSSSIVPTIFCIVLLLLVVFLDLLKVYGRLKERFFGFLLMQLKQGFFMPPGELKQWKDFTIVESIVMSITSIMLCYIKLFKGFAILLAVAGVAVIFKNASDFEEFLKLETDQLNVIQAFQLFRDFMEAINEIIGPIIFGISIVCAPTFFVANLANVLVSWNFESPITWLTMLIYSFVLTGAAEVINKTDEFREWILESGEGEYEQQLFGMFIDLTQNPVGIRGMQCFTVTYSLLAQIFSAVVTFTIILLQFKAA